MNRWKYAGIIPVLLFLLVGCGDSGAEPLSVTEAQNGEALTLVKGQEFILTLPGNPTTGYQWTVPQGFEATLPLRDSSYEPESNAIGSGGHYTFRFQAAQTGIVNLRLTYGRSWEPEPIDTFSLTVEIQE
jgi:inhibitor of cysteine peptidase